MYYLESLRQQHASTHEILLIRESSSVSKLCRELHAVQLKFGSGMF
jgi:hypothetical protein